MKRICTNLVTSLALAATLAGCGVNPVTGKKELQFVGEAEEIAIGREQYAPSRQMQGGDLTIDPTLTAYVQEVGQKLGKVADRQLPYEFVVLNNGVPNAWALPGGKIAVNRGLLTSLNSEAELAAVLGHEIVHAAARHGAKSVERGMVMQGAMVALAVGASDNQYANLIVGGAMLGANLITTRYGREAELESDRYGMLYMQRAGYDPRAAISLQETFVKLSEGRKSGWLDGMFASHPPSAARVAANRETAAKLGDSGQLFTERWQQRTAELRRTAPAYAAYDEGVAALRSGDLPKSQALAEKAIKLEPREAKFHELLGDAAMAGKNYSQAVKYYDKALGLNPTYFKPYLASGVAKFNLKDRAGAEPLIARSMELLPTATGAYLLGRFAQERGDVNGAMKYFQAAAGSDSAEGKESRRALAVLDLPRNPAQYFAIEARLAKGGEVYAIVQNRAPIAVSGVRFVAAVVDQSGRITQGPYEVTLGRQILQPGETATVGTRLGPFQNGNALPYVKFQVQAATPGP